MFQYSLCHAADIGTCVIVHWSAAPHNRIANRTGFWVYVALMLNVIRYSCHFFLDIILFHHDFHHDSCDYHLDFFGHYLPFNIHFIVHGPEEILVPSGWAKLGNVFHVHICPVHYLSHDRPLNSAAFMWLSPMFIILFPKNNIFVFFNDFQIIFKVKPSSMIVLIKYNCCNTS